MIYSFLDKEITEKLNVTPDVIFSKHKKENLFRFKIEGRKLIVTDTTFNFSGHIYENVNIIELKVGDQIIAEAMDGSTVVELNHLGVKVSLHTNNKLVSIRVPDPGSTSPTYKPSGSPREWGDYGEDD